MGILDNVKSRLGFGNTATEERSWHDEDYPDEYYENVSSRIDDQGAVIRSGVVMTRGNGANRGAGRGNGANRGAGRSDGNGNSAGEGYFERPTAMRTFGVDRADYYTDNHVPLVSQHDVRSHTIAQNSYQGHSQDRIPAPRAYPRSSPKTHDTIRDDDASAFKNGLARTPSSFAQLHSARLRMEDSGKIVALSADTIRNATSLDDTDDLSESFEENGFGQSRQRAYRKVEHVLPITYADAEQIARELKKGSVVVLDLRTTRPELAKRILDFSFGVASALDGQVERYVDRVYLFTINGAIQDVERAAIRV